MKNTQGAIESNDDYPEPADLSIHRDFWSKYPICSDYLFTKEVQEGQGIQVEISFKDVQEG